MTIEGKAAERLAELTAASGRSADFCVAYMIEEYAAVDCGDQRGTSQH